MKPHCEPTVICGPNAELTLRAYHNKIQECPGDVGIDLFPLVRREKWDVHISHTPFGQIWRIETGVAIHIPEGHFGIITSRSSSVTKLMGCTVHQGIIDHGYTGPLYVTVIVPVEHGGDQPYTLELMQRFFQYSKDAQAVAQMLIIPYAQLSLEIVQSMPRTNRGSNGFGSTDDIPKAGDL